MHVMLQFANRILIALAVALMAAGCETTSRQTSQVATYSGDSAAIVADDLTLAKRSFRGGNFGLAERHYRRAVERQPDSAESWLGLAASYDQLGRFDLADRAYTNARKIAGPVPALLNNQGYSYMLRGDLKSARRTLKKALAADPKNLHIKGNLELVRQKQQQG